MATRADVEAVLVSRLAGWLTFAGLDGTTVNGSNASLSEPISWAIRQAGGTTASITTATNTDLATVGDDDELLEYATLATLRKIDRNLTRVDMSSNGVSASLNQVRRAVKEAIKEQAELIAALYGGGVSELESGVISLGFQQVTT